ncbi:uncharacterized protein LOC115373942 isoform X2 [Myripristis murdjan]|uniref:uncharacterized protein LOC115373942 isoform X2 n=1 Tax=Myripristis murdjan TaxID=586833 RepID=UPI0011763440|nr:uncharacterized protein LOC115373942 isoform X2 [Myripristis murdjan]
MAGMHVPLVICLRYCTPKARAAALGLDYPGVHGAPSLLGPAHPGIFPHSMLLRPQLYENDNYPGGSETELDMAYHSQNQPMLRFLGHRTHEQASPRGPESTPFLLNHGSQTEYSTDELLSPPRGQSVINRKPNFEQVKHVAPSTRPEAPGQPDLVNRDPQGHNEPFSFVYSEHDLVVDESVPMPHDVSLSGFSQPQSRGHSAYQRGLGLTGYGLKKREGPVLRSSHFTQKGHASTMSSLVPAGGRRNRNRFPGPVAKSLLRGLDVRLFVQSKPVLRRLKTIHRLAQRG